MTVLSIRPRFKHKTNETMEEVRSHLTESVKKHGDEISLASSRPNNMVFVVPPKDQHFWSPQLSLSIESIDDKTIIRGLYGPKPAVWTFFAFLYVAFSLAALFSAIIGYSYKLAEKESSIYWLVLVFLACIGIIYLIAQAGKKISMKQMVQFHHFYENTMGDKVEVH